MSDQGIKGDEILQEVEILGHKMGITHISSRVADGIWYKENELIVWLDCQEDPFGGIIGMAVHIPVRDYSKEDLLAAVVTYGEPQVKDTVARHLDQYNRDRETRRQESAMREIAESIEARLK